MREPRRLLVMSPNWLGDAVMALPAIADLRRAWPAVHLVVAARASVAGMFERVPGVHEALTLTWTGKRGDRPAFLADVQRLRAAACDTALLMPNSFAAAWVVRRARVPQRWGYRGDMRSWLLTQGADKPRGSLHQGAYYQRLVRELGVKNGPLVPVLDAWESDQVVARRLLGRHGWDGRRRLVALAPGAAYGAAKQWLPEYFTTLVGDLVGNDAATCVLVGGPGDAATTALVRASLPVALQPHVIDAAGTTSLHGLIGVLSLADACVSNDSGAMHVAAALGVPVVALFGPTREHETAPLARADRPTRVLTHAVDCRPCMLRECPIDHRCMSRLLPAEVHGAVREVALHWRNG